jgi:tripartite-type tricarboxylate transporter receptor subunit TctC
MKGKLIKIILLAMVFTFIEANLSSAQDKYPSKPINFVVGFPPGGIQDNQARAIVPHLTKELGVPIVVVNKPGAMGVVGVNFIAGSKPDGYTIMNAGLLGVITAPYTYDVTWKPEDLTFLMGHSTYNQGIIVRPDAPWKTFKDWMEHVRKNPGFKYGTSGYLSYMHLLIEWIAKREGLKVVHLPYAGVTGIPALLGGHIDLYAMSGGHMPYVTAGKLRLFLQMSGNPADHPGVEHVTQYFKDPPTVINLPIGIFGPKGMPEPIVRRLSEALRKSTIENPDFKKVNDTMFVEVKYVAPDEIVRQVKAGYPVFGEVLKELNLAPKKEQVK